MSLGNWWGLALPEGKNGWGARAIYRDGTIDLLHDRQGIRGDSQELAALLTWLDEKALPTLRVMGKNEELPDPQEADEVKIQGDGFILLANPRRSYGYLYLAAWPDESCSAPLAVPKRRPVNDTSRRCPKCTAYPESLHSASCPSLDRIAARQARSGVKAPRRAARW